MSSVWTERFHLCRNVNSSYKPGSDCRLGDSARVCKAETNEELRNVDKIKYSNMVGQVSSRIDRTENKVIIDQIHSGLESI